MPFEKKYLDVLMSSKRQDWETPPELFDYVNGIFGFDLDACATEENTKVRSDFLSPEDDALSMPWGKLLCFNILKGSLKRMSVTDKGDGQGWVLHRCVEDVMVGGKDSHVGILGDQWGVIECLVRDKNGLGAGQALSVADIRGFFSGRSDGADSFLTLGLLSVLQEISVTAGSLSYSHDSLKFGAVVRFLNFNDIERGGSAVIDSVFRDPLVKVLMKDRYEGGFWRDLSRRDESASKLLACLISGSHVFCAFLNMQLKANEEDVVRFLGIVGSGGLAVSNDEDFQFVMGMLEGVFEVRTIAPATVWINPPYGKPESKCKHECLKKVCEIRGYHLSDYSPGLVDWVKYAVQQVREVDSTVVCLLPARIDTAWFQTVFDEAVLINFMRGRWKFVGADSGATFPSCLAVFSRRIPPSFVFAGMGRLGNVVDPKAGSFYGYSGHLRK